MISSSKSYIRIQASDGDDVSAAIIDILMRSSGSQLSSLVEIALLICVSSTKFGITTMFVSFFVKQRNYDEFYAFYRQKPTFWTLKFTL